MPELFHTGERKIVSSLIDRFDPSGERLLGDDCAMLEDGFNYLLMTTDMITRTSHMPDGATPEDIGWYAAAVNLSDIAAMGGEPLGMLFAFGLPRNTKSDWLDALISGILECCSRFNAPVLGGDTKENPEPTITGTAFGKVGKDRVLRRRGARPGDLVAMTGALGRGILWEKEPASADMLLRVEPRLDAGKALVNSRAATSCIDLSDGLSTSLHLLAKAGNIGFLIDEVSLPLMPLVEAEDREKAIHWGGDFELLFTLRPEKARDVFSMGLDITGIGTVTEGSSILMEADGVTRPLPDGGYEHFRRREL